MCPGHVPEEPIAVETAEPPADPKASMTATAVGY